MNTLRKPFRDEEKVDYQTVLTDLDYAGHGWRDAYLQSHGSLPREVAKQHYQYTKRQARLVVANKITYMGAVYRVQDFVPVSSAAIAEGYWLGVSSKGE